MSSSISEIASSTASTSSSASHSAAGLVDTAANPAFKIVGICLAVGSGFFIGASFVVKKKGLLSATEKYGNQAGEGHAYLKSWLWWVGMTMMIIGEILNFVAYAFTEAILVTPMGALSVVICAILSHFMLQETLTFFGWIGCVLCIIGATILALNAPEQQSVTTIVAFKKLFLSVGFLVWGSLLIVASLVIVFFVAPKWGKTHMLPYIAVCSLIGGISVSCTQGLGASIVTSIQGDNQVKNWFFWFLFVFVVITLLTEINYLNKALELYNAAMVVPVYFCCFSSATLITSFILYQGLHASAASLITMVLGFLTICLGITLLQMSKVDPKKLQSLDRKSTMLFAAAQHPTEEAEKGEVTALENPGMDALRGGFGAIGSIIRARSVSRRLSNASSWAGNGGGGGEGKMYPYDMHGNLSTHGLANLQRFSLSDTPMPGDAMEQVAMHNGRSPRDSQAPPFIGRSKSHLKFDEADVVHQYGYGRDDEATHEYRAHPTSRSREASTSTSYPPFPTLPEEDILPHDHAYDQPRTAPLASGSSHQSYSDPYDKLQPLSARPRLESTPSTSSAKGFGGIFHFSHSADPSKITSEGDVRGGAHRGVRDYPHLSKKEKEVEKEERRGLVLDTGEDEEGQSGDLGRGSFEEEPRSAVTEESEGHVLRAERWSVGGSGRGEEARDMTARGGVSGPRGPRGPGR